MEDLIALFLSVLKKCAGGHVEAEMGIHMQA
jgi:hypothetical protein